MKENDDFELNRNHYGNLYNEWGDDKRVACWDDSSRYIEICSMIAYEELNNKSIMIAFEL